MSDGQPHMLQLIDLTRFTTNEHGDLFYDRKPIERESQKWVRLPMDFPGYLRVVRVTKQPTTDATGKATIWEPVAITLELDLFTFGVKVYVKVAKTGVCTVMKEDAEGLKTLAKYTKEPK